MDAKVLAAVVDAIKWGVLAADSPLSVLEFDAIHVATLHTVAVAKRKLVVELVNNARQDFKEQVETLAARIP